MIEVFSFVKEYFPKSYNNFERFLYMNNKDIPILLSDQVFSTYKYFELLPLEFQIGIVIKFLISRGVNMKDVILNYDNNEDFETNFKFIIMEGFKKLEFSHEGRLW